MDFLSWSSSTSKDSLWGKMQMFGHSGTGNRHLAHRSKAMNLDDMVPLFLPEEQNSGPCWESCCSAYLRRWLLYKYCDKTQKLEAVFIEKKKLQYLGIKSRTRILSKRSFHWICDRFKKLMLKTKKREDWGNTWVSMFGGGPCLISMGSIFLPRSHHVGVGRVSPYHLKSGQNEQKLLPKKKGNKRKRKNPDKGTWLLDSMDGNYQPLKAIPLYLFIYLFKFQGLTTFLLLKEFCIFNSQ